MTSDFSDDGIFQVKALLSYSTLRNLDSPRLYEEAVRRREAIVARSGALVVDTGAHTGRSPQDKYICSRRAHGYAHLVGKHSIDDIRAFWQAT